MIRINLLPVREAQRRERVRQHLSVLILSTVALLVVGVAVYVQFTILVGHQERKNSELQSQVNALQSKIGKVNQLKKLKQELEKKLAVLAELKSNKEGPVRMMDTVVQSLPDKAWIESLSKKGRTIEIHGMALDENGVAQFMRNLESMNTVTSVDLRETREGKAGNIRVQKFVLSATTKSINDEQGVTRAGR